MYHKPNSKGLDGYTVQYVAKAVLMALTSEQGQTNLEKYITEISQFFENMNLDLTDLKIWLEALLNDLESGMATVKTSQ